MRYTVVLVPDEATSRYVANVPALPGGVTYGDTVESALAMAHDAAKLILESMAEHGEEIPDEPTGTVIATIDVVAPVPVEATA